MELFTDAILFAARAHNGQVRKDGTTPYINHPLEVMHMLVHTAKVADTEILMAAVLHDVVEDTEVTSDEIADRFGLRISKLVLELTDDKHLDKEERKRQQLITADLISPSARLIRISDKICNVYDILYAPPGNWPVSRRIDYLNWAEAVIDKIRGTNEAMENRFDQLIREGRGFLTE
jgi:guanosine-3',5'-bis(diphosphate) 3'-pyrophosphohydrolase